MFNMASKQQPHKTDVQNWKEYFSSMLSERKKRECEEDILRDHIDCLIEFSVLGRLMETAYFLEKAKETISLAQH